MRRRFWWTSAAVLLVLCVAIVQMPARVVAWFIPDQQLQLRGITGTVWRGEVTSAVIVTPAGGLHLGSLRWRLHPTSLLTLSPRLDFATEWGRQRSTGQVQLGARSVALTGVSATLDAGLVQQVAPLSLEGLLKLQFEQAVIRGDWPESLSGRMVWENAAWPTGSGRLPLGTYALEMQSRDDGRIDGTVLTLAGPVLAEGSVTARRDRIEFDLFIEGERALQPQLIEALALIATPEDSGYRVRFSATMPGSSGATR